jgi:hypothetical protein
MLSDLTFNSAVDFGLPSLASQGHSRSYIFKGLVFRNQDRAEQLDHIGATKQRVLFPASPFVKQTSGRPVTVEIGSNEVVGADK